MIAYGEAVVKVFNRELDLNRGMAEIADALGQPIAALEHDLIDGGDFASG